MTLEYGGRDAGGVTREGSRETDSPREVIAEFWPHNWSSLNVFNERGSLVGQIARRKGRRAWWASEWTETTP